VAVGVDLRLEIGDHLLGRRNGIGTCNYSYFLVSYVNVISYSVHFLGPWLSVYPYSISV
jgi:hypothetical protein